MKVKGVFLSVLALLKRNAVCMCVSVCVYIEAIFSFFIKVNLMLGWTFQSKYENRKRVNIIQGNVTHTHTHIIPHVCLFMLLFLVSCQYDVS